MLNVYLSVLDTEQEKNDFEKLYYEYRQEMYFRSYNILKDSYAAEDAVHEAFIRLADNFSRVDIENRYKTKAYIVVIVENISKNMYNKRRRENEVELDVTISSGENVERDISDKIAVEQLVVKIKNLPQKYREVLILRYFNEMEDKEIAFSLNIKEATVRKRLERARKELLNSLSKEEFDE